MPTFDAWYADLLGERELEVRRLMSDGRAIRFLIAWSLFESRCFKASANEQEIRDLAYRLVSGGFNVDSLSEAFGHFYARYQDEARLRHLLSKKNGDHLIRLLGRPAAELDAAEQLFLVLFVVFRFRNNIFHGNKGVQSWMQYGEQIQYCTGAMQAVISHVESHKQRAAA